VQLLIEVLRRLRPRVLDAQTFSRFLRDQGEGGQLMSACLRWVDEVHAGGMVLPFADDPKLATASKRLAVPTSEQVLARLAALVVPPPTPGSRVWMFDVHAQRPDGQVSVGWVDGPGRAALLADPVLTLIDPTRVLRVSTLASWFLDRMDDGDDRSIVKQVVAADLDLTHAGAAARVTHGHAVEEKLIALLRRLAEVPEVICEHEWGEHSAADVLSAFAEAAPMSRQTLRTLLI